MRKLKTVEDYTKLQEGTLRKFGYKICRTNSHEFSIVSKMCVHKHCRKCGVCQCSNGCLQILN